MHSAEAKNPSPFFDGYMLKNVTLRDIIKMVYFVMEEIMRIKYCFLTALIIFALAFAVTVTAEEPTEAEQLPLSLSGASSLYKLTDGDEASYRKLSAGTTLTVTAEQGISSLYVVFDRIPGEWTISDGETSEICGKNDFLHEYVDVKEIFGYEPTTVYLTFSESDVTVSEVSAFENGELPSWVQVWESPCDGEADLMLCSTHSDDEQLFFAGVLPYFAGELGLNVQVVYFTSPFSYHDRPHEQLNGLWEVGVRHYPIYGETRDKYSETKEDAYAHQASYGITRDEIVEFQVEMLRRFRPLVVIGHDFAGEYSHGQHIINTDTLVEALELATDETKYPDSAAKYGIWDTPKTYIHLYKENPIVMDWDQPLEAFGGKTAFQVTQDGFAHHKSQHWTWFYGWIYGKNGNTITKATEIRTYSPCKYGLYRTTVGLDSGIGDMFENVMTYAEQEEERLRLEEESRRAESESISREEESSRLESIAESESLRLEEESRYAESESLRLEEESKIQESIDESIAESEEERLEKEQREDKKRTGLMTVAVVSAVAVAIVVAAVSVNMNSRKKKKLKRRKKL